MYISTGSYLNSMWAMEDRCIDDAIMNSLVLLYFIKKKFHVAMGLCISRSQKKSEYGSNISNREHTWLPHFLTSSAIYH